MWLLSNYFPSRSCAISRGFYFPSSSATTAINNNWFPAENSPAACVHNQEFHFVKLKKVFFSLLSGTARTLKRRARGSWVNLSVMERAINSMRDSTLSSMATNTLTHRDCCSLQFRFRNQLRWWWSSSMVPVSSPHPPLSCRPMISCCCCRHSTLATSVCACWKDFFGSGTEVWVEMAVGWMVGVVGERETNADLVVTAAGWRGPGAAVRRQRGSAPAPATVPWSLDLVIWLVAPVSPADTLPEATRICSASHKRWRWWRSGICPPGNAATPSNLFCGLLLQVKKRRKKSVSCAQRKR